MSSSLRARIERRRFPLAGLLPLLLTVTVALALAITAAAPAHAQGATPAATGDATKSDAGSLAREAKLANELRCLVCQNQSIAESNAELAVDLRRQIRELIAQGRSDAEIRDYMTARYGDFVLYRPPLKGTTMLLWFGPGLLLALGVAIAMRFVRGRQAGGRRGDAVLTPEEHTRAARLLGEPAPLPASEAPASGAAPGDGSRATP